MKVMISLVGGRPLPNVLLSLHCKPDVQYFIVSKDSAGADGDYQKTLQGLPGDHQPQGSQEVSPYSIEESIAAVREFACRHLEDEIILNATSGPKTMAFGMYEVAKELATDNPRLDICYLGYEGLVWVFRGKTEPVTIGLKQYFESYGWSVDGKQMLSDQRFASLTNLFADRINTTPQLLKIMRSSDKGTGRRTIRYRKAISDEQFSLLKSMEEFGFLENVQRTGTITSWTIPDGAMGKFLLAGDWLEYWVYLVAASLDQPGKAVFTEYSWGVEDRSGKGEIDFVGISGGQLIIASCKTESSIERQWLDDLYAKAEQLGKGMCSALFITTVAKPNRGSNDLKRYEKWARERKLILVFAEDLPRLGSILHKLAKGDRKAEPADIPLYARI